MWKGSATVLCLLITNIYGLEYNHQLRLQLLWYEQLYMAIRAQMPYLKARSLEPEVVWMENTKRCCQVEPERNSSRRSFPDEETYFMRDEDNKG